MIYYAIRQKSNGELMPYDWSSKSFMFAHKYAVDALSELHEILPPTVNKDDYEIVKVELKVLEDK